MGRMTNLQVINAEKKFKRDPTVTNELNFVTWKLRQLSESGGMPFYNKEENVCIMPSGREGSSDHVKCLSISNQYHELKQKQKLLEIKIQQTKEIKIQQTKDVIPSVSMTGVAFLGLLFLILVSKKWVKSYLKHWKQ